VAFLGSRKSDALVPKIQVALLASHAALSKINFKIFAKTQPSKRDQSLFVIFANQTQNCSECSPSFLYCVLLTVYFLLPYFLLYQTFTLLPAPPPPTRRMNGHCLGNFRAAKFSESPLPFLFLHSFPRPSVYMPGQALSDPEG
jgi:hypothetical protein